MRTTDSGVDIHIAERLFGQLAQAFNPSGPENLKASLSLKFQGLFDAE